MGEGPVIESFSRQVAVWPGFGVSLEGKKRAAPFEAPEQIVVISEFNR